MVSTSSSQYADPGLALWRETSAGLDWLALRFSSAYSGVGIERGRGQAVILVPGLFAADASTIELRLWLGRIGYRAYESGIGVNALPVESAIARLLTTIDRAYTETCAPVRLIGHSLGGLIARGAALRRPDRVAQVITLGSPVNGLSAHPAVIAAARLVHGDDIDGCLATLQQSLSAEIAETNIYSKADGVVDWRTCFRDGAAAIEVSGSHSGLITNAGAYRVIASELAARSDPNERRNVIIRHAADVRAPGSAPAPAPTASIRAA